MVFVGIDWADQHHDLVALSAEGQLLGHCRVAHSLEGMAALAAFLAGCAASREDCLCVVEATQGLLVTALLEAGYPVAAVNPTTTSRLRPPSGLKTDTLDALLLARSARSQWPDLPLLRPDAALIAELKTLTRDLEHLIATQTRLVNQLTACLKSYYPGALAGFADLTRRVALGFLQAYPTPEQAAQASVADLEAFLARAHYTRGTSSRAQRAQQLHALLQAPQLQATPAVVRAKARLTQALVAQLLVLKDHLTAYDQAIARLCVQHEDHYLFASLPGAGPRLAPRLLAEWGDDRTRYAGAASVQALAGTAPVVFQSGTYRGVRRRLACVNPLRQALYHFALESVLFEAWAKRYYQRKRAQGKTRAMALRALANQWVRIIYAMWVHRMPYDPAVFQAAQLAHGGIAASG
jgi:transposase